MFALNLGQEGRIMSASYSRFAIGNSVLVETLPPGNIAEYRYTSDGYIHDPLPKQAQREADIWEELDMAYREGVNSL